MKRYLLVLSIVVFLISCKDTNQKNNKEINLKVNQQNELNTQFISFQEWWGYHTNNINFTKKFIPSDENLIGIDYKYFFEKLKTGNYICVRKVKDNIVFYSLTRLNDNADINIRKTIKNIADKELYYFKKRTINVPEFNFIDIKGNSYLSSELKDRYIVLKCWFINCKACVEEIDALNEFVEGNRDLVYIGLALDDKDKLNSFLETKQFNFNHIVNQEKYIKDSLGVFEYPTLVLIDKNGKIDRYFNSAYDLISYYNEYVKSGNANTPNLTPPKP